MPGTAHIFLNFQTHFLRQLVFCLSSTGLMWAIYAVFEKKYLTGTILYPNNKLPVLRRPQNFHEVFSLAGTSTRRSAFAATQTSSPPGSWS